MKQLQAILERIDGRGYKAYKQLAGTYSFDRYQLLIDHVQGDPFAEPSRMRVRLDATAAGFPDACYANRVRRRALTDYLSRRIAAEIGPALQGSRGAGRSGEILIARCGQQVLLRDAVVVSDGAVEARLGLALPADGRRILGEQARQMLCQDLPRIVEQALVHAALDPQHLQRHLDSVEDQAWLRDWLAEAGLVAFVGDGSVLPRRSGIDDRPLETGAIGFEAPESMVFTPQLPHAGRIRGMGIGRGVSLIVGGGFHGKSTLLQALQLGVYDHVPGDGRERVVCEPTAVKIRAEDGRAISAVDISPFINNLPFGRDTVCFSTSNASGSTSQAANIVEALCAGAGAFLIDEDTTASNFMLRDPRMARLVAADREPITPLVDRVRELYTQAGVSTILVSGGSSAFLDVADRVIMMDQYQAVDVSEQAAALAEPTATKQAAGAIDIKLSLSRRIEPMPPRSVTPGRLPKVQAFGTGELRIDAERIELGRLEQLVETGQVLAIGHLVRVLLAQTNDGSLLERLRKLLTPLADGRFEALSPYPGQPHGGLSLPRLHELYAAVNRMRSLTLAQPGDGSRT